MSFTVTASDRLHSSDRVESTASADTARNVLGRLTGISPVVDVTITVTNDSEEAEAAKFLDLVTSDARYTPSITGERVSGDPEAYKVFVTVAS